RRRWHSSAPVRCRARGRAGLGAIAAGLHKPPPTPKSKTAESSGFRRRWRARRWWHAEAVAGRDIEDRQDRTQETEKRKQTGDRPCGRDRSRRQAKAIAGDQSEDPHDTRSRNKMPRTRGGPPPPGKTGER